MKTIFYTIIISTLLTGCSFKTQTNPIPKENKINIPNNYEVIENGVISQNIKDDFDRYAMLLLTNKNYTARSIENIDEENIVNFNYDKAKNPHLYNRDNIWQTGLSIANRSFKDNKWKE